MLCNPQVLGMLVKRHAIANHTQKIFHYYVNYICKNYFVNAPSIAFTHDAWTSPNQLPFMTVTAHFITEDWKMMDLVIGIPLIQGM